MIEHVRYALMACGKRNRDSNVHIRILGGITGQDYDDGDNEGSVNAYRVLRMINDILWRHDLSFSRCLLSNVGTNRSVALRTLSSLLSCIFHSRSSLNIEILG